MNRAFLLAAAGAGAYLAYRALKPRYDVRDQHVLITGGSRGLGLVLERSGGTWRVLPAPGDGGMTLRSVVGFSPGRVLTCDSRGRVWRFDGTTWVLLYAQPNGNACNDLGALAEDDVWAVGDKGFVVHWPD